MDDLISRQAAIKAIENLHDCDNGFSDTYDKACIIGVIEDVPSAQQTGRWIPQDHNEKHGNVSTCIYFCPICSECGYSGDFNMNYCPNCGSKMEAKHE